MKTKWEKGLFIFYAALIALVFMLVLAARAGAATTYGPCQIERWGPSQLSAIWYNGPWIGGGVEFTATMKVTNRDTGEVFVTGTDAWHGEGVNPVMVLHGDFSGESWMISNLTCIARYPTTPVIEQTEGGVWFADFHTMQIYLPGIWSISQ